MIDTDQLKRQVNIVDIIDSYVPLKKQGGGYVACCPFHNEKTPSFTVDEAKQFFHCFGCGAHGDVVTFLREYNGWDFRQAAKSLGADIESMPLEKIQRNEKRIVNRYRLPPDHKQDEELAAQAMQTSPDEYLPISTADGDLVNAYCLRNKILLSGDSYNAAHWIIKNDKPIAIAVVSYELGCKIASKYNINVAVCFTDAILKYMCKWNHGEYKLKPALTKDDDDYLAYDMPWLMWDGEQLTKMGVKE